MNRLTYILATALAVTLMMASLYLVWLIVADLPRLIILALAVWGVGDLLSKLRRWRRVPQ